MTEQIQKVRLTNIAQPLSACIELDQTVLEYSSSLAVGKGVRFSKSRPSLDLFRHTAVYIDKVLKGTNPADISCRAACAIRFRREFENRQSA
jgi:hypothetical protein